MRVSARIRRRGRVPYIIGAVIIGAVCAGSGGFAFGKDDNDDGASKTTPTTYLDMRTSYAAVPSGALPIGLGNTALFTTLQSLALARGSTVPTSTGVTLPSAQSVVVDFPLTVDVTDRVSLYAGISASSASTPLTGWSPVEVTSWNIGFQADVYKQNGGLIPTLTWQSTITQSIPNGPFATTTFNNIFEFDYAFNKDETKGLIVGVQDTRVEVGSALARIHPNILGYLGGYYQWPNNWKFIARAGAQSFGGARLLNLTPAQSFIEPIVRFDFDRMDDNDNRLFGITAQIMWVPKPAYQLTLRTPLYFVRN